MKNRAIETRNKQTKQVTAVFAAFMLLFLLAQNTVFAGDFDGLAAGAYEMYGSLSNEEISMAVPLSVSANTLFSFSIPQKEYVRFSVFDTKGKKISVLVNDFRKAGDFSVDLNKAKLSPGTYYYRLVVGRYREVRRLDIIK